MFKLSKKIDYGLIAIQHMASHGNNRAVNTKEIAQLYNIPVELLAKVLQRLAKRGLISSQNGPKGGYLVRDGVTVGDVINAIEGPIRIVECIHEDGEQCQQLEFCTIRTPLQTVQASIIQLLHNMTIEDINTSNAFIPVTTIKPTLVPAEGAK